MNLRNFYENHKKKTKKNSVWHELCMCEGGFALRVCEHSSPEISKNLLFKACKKSQMNILKSESILRFLILKSKS